MADKASDQDQHSIEEILASIRQIISDDEDTGVAEPAPNKEEDSVLELTQVVESDSEVVETKEKSSSSLNVSALDDFDSIDVSPLKPELDMLDSEEALEDDDLDSNDAFSISDVMDEVIVEAVEEEAVSGVAPKAEKVKVTKAAVREEKTETGLDMEILTDNAASAALKGFMKLQNNTAIERSSASEASGQVTLEDIVRDLMRPMLRDWLDQNLPPIIEKVVEKELDKLARKALED
jgi:cell pole-organizing protein PopZ